MLQLPFGSAPIPLLLDPSGSTITWLQEYLKMQSISYEVSSQTSERFTYTLELAVRFGKCLIVQDVQQVQPPLLGGLISATIHSRFNKKLLQVGNKLVDFHDNFKLILVTKLSHLDIGQEIGAYLTMIPFTTTVSGYTGTDHLKKKSM